MKKTTLKNHCVYYDSKHDLYFTSPGGFVRKQQLKPLSICLNIWNQCNLRCMLCLSNSTASTSSQLPVEKLLSVLSDLIPLRLVWSGGEPTLNTQLPYWIEKAISKRFYNVITTNLTIRDNLSSFVGEFFYNVSIYGIKKEHFYTYTGKDLFKEFIKNFEEILKIGHKVCANIIITQRWREYLPNYIQWLKQYPIRKLLLSNMLLNGRNIHRFKPADRKELDRLRCFLSTLNLIFPVIYPDFESTHTLKQGYIAIETAVEKEKLANLNGISVNNVNDLLLKLRQFADENRKLFLTQNYLFYNDKCC